MLNKKFFAIAALLSVASANISFGSAPVAPTPATLNQVNAVINGTGDYNTLLGAVKPFVMGTVSADQSFITLCNTIGKPNADKTDVEAVAADPGKAAALAAFKTAIDTKVTNLVNPPVPETYASYNLAGYVSQLGTGIAGNVAVVTAAAVLLLATFQNQIAGLLNPVESSEDVDAN